MERSSVRDLPSVEYQMMKMMSSVCVLPIYGIRVLTSISLV